LVASNADDASAAPGGASAIDRLRARAAATFMRSPSTDGSSAAPAPAPAPASAVVEDVPGAAVGVGGGDEEDEEEVVFSRPAGMTDTPTTSTTAAPAAADPTAAAQAATSPGAVPPPAAAAAAVSPVPRGRPGAASLAAAALAEEEAALNMAILLSLRDNRPVATAAGGEQPTAANPTVPATEAAAAPAEADIAQLEGMGFPRADAVAALQATGNDVARAADRLLGAG